MSAALALVAAAAAPIAVAAQARRATSTRDRVQAIEPAAAPTPVTLVPGAPTTFVTLGADKVLRITDTPGNAALLFIHESQGHVRETQVEFDGIPQHHPDPNVREFARAAAEADGFVLASPVYHNSYTGVLKNALDSLGDDQFEGKPIGLVGHKGIQPVDHLRIVVRSVGAYAITRQVVTRKNEFRATADGYVLDSETLTHRINVFCDELLDWIEKFRGKKS